MVYTENELKYTRLDGEVRTQTEMLESMLNYYHDLYNQDLSSITDLSEGSELRNLLESFVLATYDVEFTSYEQFKQTFITYAKGNYLDLKACEFKINRKQGTAAIGVVTFSLPQTQEQNVIIPQGTVILHRIEGYEYVLSTDVTIAAGTNTANGTVYSKIVGEKYNAAEGTLTAFREIATIRRDLKVTNNEEITGGTDTETDEQLRQRILDAKKERAAGTLSYYKNMIVNQVEEVHDVAFINPNDVSNHYKTITKSDGTSSNEKCTDCMRVIYVNGYAKPCPTDVLQEVESLVTHQDNLIVGHEFHVQSASNTTVYFEIKLYTIKNATISESDIVTAINAYMNGGSIFGDEDAVNDGTSIVFNGLNLGEAIQKERLLDAIESLPQVSQVDDIVQIHYNNNLPTGIGEWTKIGNQQYQLVTGGYTYTRNGDTINKWGSRKFTSISVPKYSVGRLGHMKNVDKDTNLSIKFTKLTS